MENAGSAKVPAGLPGADCQLLPRLLHHSADLPAPYSSRHFDLAFGMLAVVEFVVAAAVGAALQPFPAELSWQVSAGLAYPALPTVAAEAEVVGSFSAAVDAFVVPSDLAHLLVEAVADAAAAWAQLLPSFPEVLAAAPSAPCSLMFVPAGLTLVALPCQYQGGLLPFVPVAVGAVASCQLAQPAFVATEPVPSFAVHLPLAESSWLSPQLQAEDLKVAVAGTWMLCLGC